MKFKLYIISIIFLSLTVGCDKKRDKIFEGRPTERLNKSVGNVYTVMQGNKAGWVMAYYPSPALEFGGYTMFVKFSNNIDVVVEGDFTTQAAQTSTYAVLPGAGPILTFDTYNSIFHYFALTTNYTEKPSYWLPGFLNVPVGARNEGMKGENDFLVLKATSDSVVLEGRKSYNKIVLTPIKSSEKASIVSSFRAATTKFNAFGGYKFEVGTETIPASFKTSATKRSLLASGNTYAYRYTPTGLSFYTAYELKGVKFKELTYVEPTGAYAKGYFSNTDGTLKLVPTT